MSEANYQALFVFLSPILFYVFYLSDVLINRRCDNPKTYVAIHSHFKIYFYIYLVLFPTLLFVLFEPGIIRFISSLMFSYFFLLWLHYLGFFQLVGLVKKSISMNVLVSIADNGGRATIEEIADRYGDGKGFSFVKLDRKDQLYKLCFVQNSNGAITPTPKGTFFYVVGRYVLRVWRLSR